MRHAALILTLLAPVTAWAVGPQTDIVGGESNNTTGSGSFKLTVFDVSQAVNLDDFAFYMDPAQPDTEVYFVVYRDNANQGFELLWNSGLVTVQPGLEFKGSGPVDLVLSPGEAYGIGVHLPGGDDVTYFYGPTGGEDIGWAFVDTGYWTQNGSFGGGGPPDPAFGGGSNSPYRVRTTVSFGRDLDGDGVGELADCDDGNPTVYPGAVEACDEIDNDCNGQVDENVVYRDFWPDADGDGFGDPDGEPVNSCDPAPPAGYADNAEDCDDGRAGVNPGATEVCDGFDTDCDGNRMPEEAIDGDGDGAPACADCDDEDPETYPGLEVDPCNGVDNDCDGEIPDPKECEADQEDLRAVSACACDAGSSGGVAWLAVLGFVAARRRR